MLSFQARCGQASALTRAIGAILGAGLLLSLSDALVRSQAGALSLGQVLVVRSAVAALVLWGALRLSAGSGAARGRVTGWVWARSLCLALMWGCYYAGLPAMSFSVAAACYYTAPIWMAVLSFALLGARIGWRGGLAIGLGLAGMAAILRPGLDAASPMVGAPLLAGFLYALAAVITHARCRSAPPISMALNLNLVLGLAGLSWLTVLSIVGEDADAGFAMSIWPAPSPSAWALLIGLGGALAVIAVLVAFAYQSAPAPVIGLFDNGYLVFALGWSALIFGDRPDPLDLVGIVLIGCGALLASLAPSRARART